MATTAVVVGAGAISNSWFPPLAQEKVEIAAVVDLRIDAAQAQIAKYDLSALASDDLAAVLARVKPDLVLDLTVPEAHRQVTCAALEAGCHVISEKPMASSMAEARVMVSVSERTGKLYMVSQNRRWSPQHEAVRRAIAQCTIGNLTTVNCDFYLGAHFGGFRDQMPSPLILDMAIHHFDLARFMSGADPVAVYAREFNPKGSWYKGDVAASCIFEMTDGVVFTYRGSWCAEGFHTSWNGDWRFIGDAGTLIYAQDQDPRAQIVAGDAGFNRPLRDESVPVPELEAVTMHGALREMLRFLSTGERPQTECHDNIKSLAMCFSAIESSKRGCRIAVES
ncbi:MAG: Gfo/Idh/MocA family protein [Armatimonadota bacterium]